MATPFLERLLALLTETKPLPLAEQPSVRLAFEDTLAVTYAGWHEPVTRRVAAAYGNAGGYRPDGAMALEPEIAAQLLGAGAHALDYDDVHLESSGHPSAVIVPALLAAVRERPETAPRLASAFQMGISVDVALGRVLGFAHYEKGWHATSTIGPIAAAAAVAYLYQLNSEHTAHALGIAAAHSGGLQRNFGAMAKPLQAGLAAAGGLRAARLARMGVTADEDIFGPKGFFDLYGGSELQFDPDSITFDPAQTGLSVKLYPACYLAHRPISAGLAVHEQLKAKGIVPQQLTRIELNGPYGGFIALRHKEPKSGLEGKFSGEHAVACAMVDGAVGLAHFETDAVQRPDIAAVRGKVEKREAPKGSPKQGLGAIEVIAHGADDAIVAQAVCEVYPGSPKSPPTPEQMEAKVRDCLAFFNRDAGAPLEYEAFQGFIDGLFDNGHAAPGH